MTEAVREALAAVARRRDWNAEALYAVISLETGRTFALDAGADRWTPERTGIGLLQLQEHAARRFGVAPSPHPPRAELAAHGGAWATWTVAAMGLADQLDLVERFYCHAFAIRRPKRPVDYYLAAWGAAPGLPDSTVLTRRGAPVAVGELRSSLDKELRRLEPSHAQDLAHAAWTLFTIFLVRRVMTEVLQTNGKASAPAPDVWQTWLVERAVARKLGVSQTYLRRCVGRLGFQAQSQTYRAADGTLRYDPVLVAALERLLSVTDEMVDDEDSPDQKSDAAKNERDVLGHALGLLKQSHTHLERVTNRRRAGNGDAGDVRAASKGWKRGSIVPKQRATRNSGTRNRDRARTRARPGAARDRRKLARKAAFGLFEKRLPSVFDALEQQCSAVRTRSRSARRSSS
jgi:hypothetical protein